MSSPSNDMLEHILPILKNGLPITIDLVLNFLRMASINLIVMNYLGSDGVVMDLTATQETLAAVEAISMSISYDYIIGMNRTVVQLNSEKHENERNISRGAKL